MGPGPRAGCSRLHGCVAVYFGVYLTLTYFYEQISLGPAQILGGGWRTRVAGSGVLPLRRLQRCTTARAANLVHGGCGPAVGGVATVVLVLRGWQQLDTWWERPRCTRCGGGVAAVLDVALATTGGSDHGG